MTAAPVLGLAIEIVNTSLDPERGHYDDEVKRAIDSYMASTFGQSILFEIPTIKRMEIVMVLSDMFPWDWDLRLEVRNIAYVLLIWRRCISCLTLHTLT